VPLVSIGVPVYNGENYLAEALSSLLQQTHRDLEVIISDNGSTDGTREIAKKFESSDSRVRYHRQPVNLGAAGNYNFTLEQAGGEYFMWNAHDDVREPRYVELALQAFRNHPGASCVFSRSARIDAEGKFRHVMRRPDELLSKDPGHRLRATIRCSHPGLIIFGLIDRRQLLQTGRHGDFPGADRVLAVELAVAGEFVELPEVLFFNRDHPDRYVRIKKRPNAGRDRLQEAWWDPARADRIVFPAWSRFRGYFHAIRTAPLTNEERRRCYIALAASNFDNGWALPRSLIKDVAQAGISVGRLARRS
jgi:glycosyltransferase involved in cell wall biosynthesis